jgi:DeoR family transcriptional regulator, suf operon transcriptional repressor
MMETTQQTSTKQDILQYLLKGGQGTALELAESLEMSPQAIRRHLKDLEAEGLIQYQSVQARMGRPQHIYELTSLGRDRFPNRYGDFAVSFLDTLAETVGREQVITILQKQWERKATDYRRLVGAGSLEERVIKLVELRRAEGYMAECYPVESVDVEIVEMGDRADKGDRFVLMEHNCAISNVAETFPSVCGNELEMFAAVLPDCTVERTHWIIDGEHRCGYLIAKKKSAVSSH